MRKILQLTPRLLILPFFVATLLILGTTAKSQQSPETWGDFINEPEITYGELRSADDHLKDERIIMSIFSSLSCEDTAYPIVGDVTFSECWYDSGGYKTTKGGNGIVPKNETKAGFTKDFSTYIFPTKYKDVLIEQSSSYDRAWIRKDSALKATLVEDPAAQNPNFWVWENPASLELQNEDGSPFYFHGDYLYAQSTFSENGRWLVFFDTSGYLVRIDLETLKISTYRVDKTEGYFWPAIAISDSGRYIAVNNRVDEFYIMDTADCTIEADRIIIPGNISDCTRRSIKQYALEHFEDLYQTWLEFYNENIARVKGLSKDGSSGEEIIIRAPNTKLGTNYIALGDSYSSGEGAYDYLPGTDEPNNRCHISNKSYPFLLDNWLGLDSTHSVACSGAMIHNIAGGHRNDAAQNSRPTQDRTLGKWIPGYKWQIEHIRDDSNPVDIVTIGISGNDIGFADKLSWCVGLSGSCYETFEERLAIALEINAQFEKLVTVLAAIRSSSLKSNPLSQIYLVGYPLIFSSSPDSRCGNNVRLTSQERNLAHGIVTHLNNMMRNAAKRAGVIYVNIEEALNGHMLCDYSPAVNGITFGNGVLPGGVYGPSIESYHPTQYGHTLIASKIREITNDFTSKTPRQDRSSTAPNPLSSLLVQHAPHSGEKIKKLLSGNRISQQQLSKDNEHLVIATGAEYNLRSNSYYEIGLTSTYTSLGLYKTNESGDLNAMISIPDTVNPGIHMLHIYGEDRFEEGIDIYKTVFIVASEDDWDGDGIPNSEEFCNLYGDEFVDIYLDESNKECENSFNTSKNNQVAPRNKIIDQLTEGYMHSHGSNVATTLSDNVRITPDKGLTGTDLSQNEKITSLTKQTLLVTASAIFLLLLLVQLSRRSHTT